MRLSYFIILTCGFLYVNAQHSISSNYTNNYIGHDFDLNYNYEFNNNKFSIGTSFLMNSVWQNNPNWEVYYKIFHAFNIADRFAIRVGYQYHFHLKNDKTSFYLSYDLRYRYGQTRSLTPVYIQIDSIGIDNIQGPFIMQEQVSPKMHALSNVIGGGVNTKLFNNFYLNAQVSAGFDSFIFNKRAYDLLNLSYLVSVGMEYKFLAKKKKKE